MEVERKEIRIRDVKVEFEIFCMRIKLTASFSLYFTCDKVQTDPCKVCFSHS